MKGFFQDGKGQTVTLHGGGFHLFARKAVQVFPAKFLKKTLFSFRQTGFDFTDYRSTGGQRFNATPPPAATDRPSGKNNYMSEFAGGKITPVNQFTVGNNSPAYSSTYCHVNHVAYASR